MIYQLDSNWCGRFSSGSRKHQGLNRLTRLVRSVASRFEGQPGRTVSTNPRPAASSIVSFEPDVVSVLLDGRQLRLEPGQTVIPHGPDHDLTVAEAHARR